MSDRTVIGIGDDGDLRIVPADGMPLLEIKEQLGATWDAEYEAWKVPALRSNLIQAKQAIPDLDLTKGARRLMLDRNLDGKIRHPRNKDLFPFQRRAVNYLATAQHGAMLCLSPGLGKTVVTIVALNEVRAGRVLIVAPASLLLNWEREVRAWSVHDNVTVAHGAPPAERGWVITTYDSVVQNPDWFTGELWDVLVLDESVLVKNRTSQRYLALAGGSVKDSSGKVKKKWAGLRKSVGTVWALSGSPTTRYADDLWTQMHLLWPKAFNSYWRFAERFCVFEDNIWAKTGKSIVGTRANVDPATELADLMLVVNQEDVLDLPDYLFETIDVELLPRQKKAYRTMLTNFFMELSGGKELEATTKLDQLIRLQQVTSGMGNFEGTEVQSAKINALLEVLENQTYELPAVIWTHWKGNAEVLTMTLKTKGYKVRWISGDSSAKTRDAMIEEFKAGAYDILVLSLGVGKFGHTLTNARTVFYLDKTWAADDYFQSLRRVRRIGLGHRPVIVTLHARGTVDELVEANLAGKMPSIAKVTNSQLKELLRGLGL